MLHSQTTLSTFSEVVICTMPLLIRFLLLCMLVIHIDADMNCVIIHQTTLRLHPFLPLAGKADA